MEACQSTQVSMVVHAMEVLTLPDDPAAYHGAPAAVLVVGRRLCEERLLSLAQVVVDALGNSRVSSARVSIRG